MKRYSVLLLMGMLLAGCSTQEIEQAKEEFTYGGINSKAHYEINMEEATLCEDLKKTIEEYSYDEPYQDVQIQYNDAEEGCEYPYVGINYSWLEIDEKGLLLGRNPILQQIDAQFMPGVMTFIEEVCGEKDNLAPQSIVINNNWMLMYPSQLYTDAYEMRGYPMMVGLNTFKLKDSYFKKLIEKVDTSQFVVHKPLLTEQGTILQMSTPFYLHGGDGAVVSTALNSEKSWYGLPNMSFRLYIYQRKLEEIHIIVKQPDSETINTEDLLPVLEWIKEEWQGDEATINGMQELINALASESLTKQKGTIGSCEYVYDIQKRKYNRGKIMELTLRPNV